jgi:hypothetical protein
MELPIYQVNFNPEDLTEGVYGISLVDEPAIGVEFIALSEQKPVEVKLSNMEKQLVTGPVLIPNQKIYRNQGGREFYLTFDESTIELLSQEFLKRGFQKNSFYNHDESEKIDLSVVESWIVGGNDKSKDLGYDLPKGSWMVTSKLSDNAWSDYVKSGKVKGFSIDSFLDMKQVTMNKLKKAHAQYIKMLEETNSIKVDGVEMYFAGALEMGTMLTDKEGNPIQASFEYQDYRYTTDMMGKIIEINQVKSIEEQPMEEMDKAAVVAEVMAILERAGIKIEDMMPAVEIEVQAPEMEAPAMEEEMAKKEKMEEVTPEEAEKAVMEDMPIEDDVMEMMKKRVQALEDKLKMAEQENMKLKKAPAATKLSQAIPSEVKQKESTMDVISRLAKLANK